MKEWIIGVLVIVGLVLFFNPKKPGPPQDLPSRAIPAEDQRVIPYDLPPPAPRASKPKMTFGGYPCNGDCADHQEGYRWAEQNGIVDPDNCTGDSGAFAEGCRVYARQRSGKAWDK